MIDRLDSIKERYNEINNMMMKTEVVTNVKLLTTLAKEQKGLLPVVEVYDEYVQVLQTIDDFILIPLN